MSSIRILPVGKRDTSGSPVAVTQNPSATWHTQARHITEVSIAQIGDDKFLVLWQRGSQRTSLAYSSRRRRGSPVYLGRAVTTGPHTRGRSLSWGVWTCAAVVRHDYP